MIRSVSLVIVAGLTAGCVAKSKHVEALDVKDQTIAALAAELEQERLAHAGTRETLERAIRLERQKVARLESRALELQGGLDTTRADLASLQAEKAELLKKRSSLQASVDEMSQALEELQGRKAAAEARIAAYRALLARFQGLIDAGKLRVRIVDGQMVVELATDVLFDSGSAALSANGQQAVTDVADVLATLPERRFQVAGHTDDVPIATAQYPSNWELAAARALNVVRTMIDAGMPPEAVSAASFGEFHPAVPNDSPEQKAQNRRIEIVLVPDLSDLPGYDELERLDEGG